MISLPAALPGGRAGQLRLRLRVRTFRAEENQMPSIKRPDPRIGVDDPEKEPLPPKIDSAGNLGRVGEKKQKDADCEYKDGIWRDSPVAGSVPAAEGNKKP